MPHNMMTSSNGNIFRVTGPLCGEFTGPGEFPTQRPVTRSFDVFCELRLNKRLGKQREAGDLRRHRCHYDVIVMKYVHNFSVIIFFTVLWILVVSVQFIHPYSSWLTHWGRDKMDAIFQTTISNIFCWMKMCEFQLEFHWSLFLRAQLTIFQHWFR